MDFNPILVKELRSRMRGNRAFITLTGILVILGAFSYGLYRIVLAALRYSNTPLSPQVGQVLFAGIALLELIMICAITPAVTSTTISSEQEKQTFEMLLATPLNPVRIITGKLISALSYVFILIFAAIPMSSMVSIFGGVSLRDMVKAFIVLVCITIMLGVLGIFMSVLFGRTGRATAISYITVFILMFGPLVLGAGMSIIRQGSPPRWLLIPSPISALASAFSPSVNMQNLSSIFWSLGNTQWIAGTIEYSQTSIPRPLYHYTLALYGALTLVLYFLSTRLIQPVRKWHINWHEALVALILSLGFLGSIATAYFVTSNRYENISIIEPTSTPTPFAVPEGLLEVTPEKPDNKQAPSTIEAGASIIVLKLDDGEAVFRAGPGVDYEIMGTLEPGMEVPALGISPDGEWIKISIPETQGGTAWIYIAFVELRGSLPVIEQ